MMSAHVCCGCLGLTSARCTASPPCPMANRCACRNGLALQTVLSHRENAAIKVPIGRERVLDEAVVRALRSAPLPRSFVRSEAERGPVFVAYVLATDGWRRVFPPCGTDGLPGLLMLLADHRDINEWRKRPSGLDKGWAVLRLDNERMAGDWPIGNPPPKAEWGAPPSRALARAL